MTSVDYDLIFNRHPGLILMSKDPYLLEGYLIAENPNDSSESTKIIIKLCAPYYPSLQDVVIQFDKKFHLLNTQEFQNKIYEILNQSSSISSVLKKLQSLIGYCLEGIHENSSLMNLCLTNEVLEDLKNLFFIPKINIMSKNELDVIKLSIDNISLVLQRDRSSTKYWKIISSELPKHAVSVFDKNIYSLTEIGDKFQNQVELFQNVWKTLSEIDENCWIIDPVKVKPYHLYRRIYLSEILSLFITVDPIYYNEIPELKFLGSNSEVEKLRSIVSKNINKWNSNHSLIDNLKQVIGIDEFPQMMGQIIKKERNGIIADEECCICYSLEMGEENFPNRICNNVKCKRYFHTECLFQWLQAVAGNQVVFDCIHGVCPHCGDNISCPIK